jgi:hypothetical protein
LRRIIGARNFFLLVVLVVFITLLARSLLGLALLSRALGLLLLLLNCVNINFIVFLITFDFFGVIYFHRQVKRLILNLFSFDCASRDSSWFAGGVGVSGLLLLNGHGSVFF